MKKKIGVWIPHEEVWNEFTELVKDKWGKKHSVLGLELEEAIKAYIVFKKSGAWGDDRELKKSIEELNKRLEEIIETDKTERRVFRQQLAKLELHVYNKSLEV